MPRKLLSLAFALGLVAAACSRPPHPELDLGSGLQFTPEVADHLDNVGVDPSLALDPDSIPYVAYFGFPEQLGEGEVAQIRPVGAPSVPGVLFANLDGGVWSHGAVAVEGYQLVEPSFGPAETDAVARLSPGSVAGTGVAVDGKGGFHVVWSAGDELWYGSNTGSGFTIESVARADGGERISGPSVTVRSGTVWLSYVAGARAIAVSGGPGKWSRWDLGAAAPDSRTSVGAGRDGAVVVFSDGESPLAARLAASPSGSEGARTRIVEIDPGGGGAGISMAMDSVGQPHAAYYDADGGVRVAASTSRAKKWSVVDVGSGGAPDGGSATGIAVDRDGTEYVAWRDSEADRVRLASGGDASFGEIATVGTEGGWSPSVAAVPDGSAVHLAWYDPVEQDLRFGTEGVTGDLVLARPSPTIAAPQPQAPAPSSAGCKADGTKLKIAAPVGAAGSGFDTDCLAVSAGEDFTIEFDNQDDGVPHNVAIYTDSSATEELFVGETFAGPDTMTYEVGALEPGEYFFRCDVHPTTMTGTFIVE